MLKPRSTPTEGEQIVQMKEWSTETRSIEFNIPAIPYGNRDCATENSQRYASSNTVLIKRQGNKPERKYQELLPGSPVWVQHRQNAIWEPAIVVNQCAPNSYWIMQENGAEQPGQPEPC